MPTYVWLYTLRMSAYYFISLWPNTQTLEFPRTNFVLLGLILEWVDLLSNLMLITLSILAFYNI